MSWLWRRGQMTAVLLCLLVIFCRIEAIRFIEQSNQPNYADPDSQGFRQCASWRLPDGTPIYSGCDPFTINRCGKELPFEYHCCSGFEKSDQSLGGKTNNPCGQMIPQFDDCASIVEQMGFSAMASYLRKVPELARKNGKPYTIFVPLPKDGSKLSQIYSGQDSAVGYHVVKGRYYAEDLNNGMTLESVYQGQKLDVFRTSYGTVSIECIEMSQADIECQSGVIHVLRQPLIPRRGLAGLDKTSIMSLLRSNKETSEFANDLPRELQRELEDVASQKKYTITAPSASSWSQMKRNKSPDQVKQIAASHVIAGQRCSAALYKSSQDLRRVDGQKTTVECDVQGPNEVRKIKDACGQSTTFTKTDQVATNGVLHMMDGPIVPSSALTLKEFMDRPECAKEQNIDKFVDVLKECDLYMEDRSQYAIIAPENEAFEWWRTYKQFKNEYQRFQTDKEYRCRIARYHIVKHDGNLKNIPKFSGHTDAHRTNNKNNYLYETTYMTKDSMGSKLNYHYSPVNNLESVPLKDTSIFRTPRVNVFPEQNITDVVGNRPDLSHSKKIMEIAKMEDVFKAEAPKNLYLVTTNDGWIDPRSKAMGKNLINPELTRYESVPSHAENFAKLNHVPLYLWGGDIGYFPKNTVHKFPSTAGVDLTFWNDDKGQMRIGYDGLPRDEWPKVVDFNQHARDGMVWTLDGILKCPPSLCPFQLEDTDVYTFFTAACLTSDLPGENDVKSEFSKNPTQIAKRHPDKCLVIKQGEVKTTKDLFEAGPMPDHDH